jgi:hypothetical protein
MPLTKKQEITLSSIFPPLGVINTLKPGIMAMLNPAKYKGMTAEQMTTADAAQKKPATTAPQSKPETYYYGGQSVGGKSTPGGGITGAETKNVATGGTVKAGGTTTGAGGYDLSALLSKFTDTSAYDKAAEAESAMLPLIQQRYKALLDEISTSEATQTAQQETAKTEQLGATKARAGATGTFYGGQELGSEEIIRKATADAEAIIQQTGDVQKAKAVAQEGIDEAQVATEIAKLGISQQQAQETGLKDALAAAMGLEKLPYEERLMSAQARTAGTKPTITTIGDRRVLVDAMTGEVIQDYGAGSAVASTSQTVTKTGGGLPALFGGAATTTTTTKGAAGATTATDENGNSYTISNLQ